MTREDIDAIKRYVNAVAGSRIATANAGNAGFQNPNAAQTHVDEAEAVLDARAREKNRTAT